jgi:hypothetical protein
MRKYSPAILAEIFEWGFAPTVMVALCFTDQDGRAMSFRPGWPGYVVVGSRFPQ